MAFDDGQFGAPFTPGPCPPVTSRTASQGFALSAIPASGSFQIQVGAVILAALQFNFAASDVQAALDLLLPGSIVQFTNGPNTPPAFTIFFSPDPTVAALVINNSLKDAGNNNITVAITPKTAVVNPNYNFLATMWEEFAETDPTKIPAKEQRILALKANAQLFVGTPFKEATCYATFLIVAHMLKLSKEPTGFVTSEKAANLAATYTEDKFLDMTVYGQEFRRLRNARIMPGFFAGSGPAAIQQLGPQQGGWY